MNKGCAVFGNILVSISCLISIVLMGFLIDSYYKDSRKFEYIWISSKIKTIKNIVRISSFKDKIFNSFSSEGKIEGLSTNYYNLLKLVKGSG